jgi:hypothetical protein
MVLWRARARLRTAADLKTAAIENCYQLCNGSRVSTFPRKRLVKKITKRFRGNATDTTGGATAIRPDALSAADADS